MSPVFVQGDITRERADNVDDSDEQYIEAHARTPGPGNWTHVQPKTRCLRFCTTASHTQ